jgi:hypothetical protein
MDDHDSISSFEKPYHEYNQIRQSYGHDDYHGDLGFWVELLEFADTLQA